MKEKTKCFLRQIGNSVLLAGFIIFCIGLYYCIVKAGIPNQGPPLELQIEYAVNMGIGEILVENGFVLVLCGGVIRLIFGLILKNHHKGNEDSKDGQSSQYVK